MRPRRAQARAVVTPSCAHPPQAADGAGDADGGAAAKAGGDAGRLSGAAGERGLGPEPRAAGPKAMDSPRPPGPRII